MQHTFLLPQMISELLDLRCRSANEDHFGAQVWSRCTCVAARMA